MAIQFSCQGCGHVLRVGDEMAGRKGKCPKCGLVNQIPFAAGSPPPAPAAVPYPAMAIAPTPVAPPPPYPQPSPATAAEPTDAAPRKKNKLLIPLLIGGIAGVFVLCCGLGFVGYFVYPWFFGAGLGSEQKYFPNGTQYVGSVRVDQALSSDFFKQIKGTLKKGADDLFDDKNTEKKLGVPLSNIDRVTVAGSVSEPDLVVILVRTKKSVKGADVKGNLPDTYKETKINDFTIFENENEAALSFAVVESDLVVFARFKPLRAVLDRGKKPELPEAMQTALKKADFGKTLAFALNIKELVTKANADKKPAPGQPSQDPLAELLGKFGASGASEKQAEKFARRIESLSGSYDVKTDMTVNLHVVCKDNPTAEDIRKLTEASLVLLKLVGDDVEEYPKDIVEDVTTNLKVTTSGSSATAIGTIKGAPIIAYSKKMNDKK